MLRVLRRRVGGVLRIAPYDTLGLSWVYAGDEALYLKVLELEVSLLILFHGNVEK
jgi:hypothetical protein